MIMSNTFMKTRFELEKVLTILEIPSQIVVSIFVWPYRLFYYENTRDPIQAIISSQDSEPTRDKVNRWLNIKLKEAQYVVTGVSLSLNSFLSVNRFPSESSMTQDAK